MTGGHCTSSVGIQVDCLSKLDGEDFRPEWIHGLPERKVRGGLFSLLVIQVTANEAYPLAALFSIRQTPA
jgi:hypothetical protein